MLKHETLSMVLLLLNDTTMSNTLARSRLLVIVVLVLEALLVLDVVVFVPLVLYCSMQLS